MAIINPENKYLTLINIFIVAPENQQQLVELLIKATDSTVKNVQGFVSSSLHKSLDGTKVTMYAQWKSIEDYQNMRRNPVASPYLDEALAIAKFEPCMYEVVKSFVPGA